ncbi:MAG: phosphatase PAP2 family protein [Sphingomicrobium sp.]
MSPFLALGDAWLSVVGVIASLPLSGLSIDPTQFWAAAAWLGAAIGLGRFRGRFAGVRLDRLIDFCEAAALFCGITTFLGVISYSAAALSSGFADQWLIASDEALGFDWDEAFRYTFTHPWAERISRYAYGSIFLSPIIVVAYLCAEGRVDRVRRFICVYGLALAVTVAALRWLPTQGPLAISKIGGDGHATAVAMRYVPTIEALRSGALRSIDLVRLEGLVSMPSFHAASGLMFTWAAWPLRWLRWPVFALNLAMIAATPVEGNHYLTDVLAGLALAVVSIWLVEAAIARRSASQRLWALVRPPELAPAG